MMQPLDHWTGEALNNMVGYIADDGRIATYLNIPLEYVVAARKRLKRGRQQRQDTQKEPKDAPDQWERDLRRASERLAEAIAEARS